MNIQDKAQGLARRYQAALGRHLARAPDKGAASSLPALRIGRQAAALGAQTLDLAVIHQHSLEAQMSPATPAAARQRLTRKASLFFAEAATPLERKHRTARKAEADLVRLNRSLKRRGTDLATATRKWELEVAHRKNVAKTLSESERKTRILLMHSRQLHRQLRSLSRRILSAQEDERKRISRELHDVIAQMLTGINLRLVSLKKEAETNTLGIACKIENTQRLVEQSVDTVHRFARELRPAVLDDLGLVPALHAHLLKFSRDTGLRARLTAFSGLEKLNDARRTVLYRLAQEALSNIARHAHATKVAVAIHLVRGRSVRMRISDNGVAFDVGRLWDSPKSGHLGLLGMRERVEMVSGTFKIQSAPGHGTTVEALIPFLSASRKAASA